MPTYANTGLTQSLSPWYGSAKVEVSTDSGTTWVNVGLARGVNFTENLNVTDIQADNGPDLQNYVSNHTVTLNFNSLEFYLPTLDKLRGGIDTLSVSTGGVATTDTDVYTTGAVLYSKPYYLDNQGATDTLAAIASIKSVDTGNSCDTLDSTRDFSTFTDASNRVGFILLSTASGGTFKDTESLRVNYVYETIQARKLSSGGLTSITPRMYRLTNIQIVSGSTKYRYITLYSASLAQGLSMALKSSNEADPVLENPISLTAKIDSSRTAGDQLFLIEDQVAVA